MKYLTRRNGRPLRIKTWFQGWKSKTDPGYLIYQPGPETHVLPERKEVYDELRYFLARHNS